MCKHPGHCACRSLSMSDTPMHCRALRKAAVIHVQWQCEYVNCLHHPEAAAVGKASVTCTVLQRSGSQLEIAGVHSCMLTPSTIACTDKQSLLANPATCTAAI
jgi:hypothetical protein